jgi:hypothetical protein
MDTDEDFLLLVEDLDEAVIKLKEIGFDAGMTNEQLNEYIALQKTSSGRLKSLRLGDVNYIITESAFFFDRFLTATHICKTLNVMDKKQRILVFEGVFGDSHLKHTSGITSEIINKVYEDIQVKTFEEGVSASPFEEDIARRLQDNSHINYVPDPIIQTVRLPNGWTITREAIEENI